MIEYDHIEYITTLARPEFEASFPCKGIRSFVYSPIPLSLGTPLIQGAVQSAIIIQFQFFMCYHFDK